MRQLEQHASVPFVMWPQQHDSADGIRFLSLKWSNGTHLFKPEGKYGTCLLKGDVATYHHVQQYT